MSNQLEQAREIINRVDAQMAALFEERMHAVEAVLAYKNECGLPIFDPQREEAVVAQNTALIQDQDIKEYYRAHLTHLMGLSRAYQHRLKGADNGIIHMSLAENSYDIVVARGVLAKAGQLLDLDRRVLVVTDTGVPAVYAETLAKQCRTPVICTIEMGEASKSVDGFTHLLQVMLDNGFSRKDCVVAVGGGVVGDVAGFAASAYMRGVDFYNIPTTLLSQIDSSIGGKTAINVGGIKNVVGAFYQPKKVLVDPDLLHTLPARHVSNGLAEVIKMALTSDRALFELLESGEIDHCMDEVILRALRIKQAVVEQDEKDAGVRKMLNFGHTIGHAIESSAQMTPLYHGECVALGLLPMCDESIRRRVENLLQKYDLHTVPEIDWDGVRQALLHDKKADGDQVTVILVKEIGTYEMCSLPLSRVMDMAEQGLKG